MKKTIILCILGVFLAETNVHAEATVFEGTPIKKNCSDPTGSDNYPVIGNDQTNYKTVITKDNGKYIWFSRDKKMLTHTNDGCYDYFITKDRCDYIKIAKNPDSDNPKYLYMEHLTDGFKTITYWGKSDKFEP